MINLPDVTLLAISSIEIPATINALLKCCDKIDFGAVKFVSDKKPTNLPNGIIYEYCPKITNTHEFDVYAFEHLYKHVQTSHMLMCQWHAFILRSYLWDDDWLKTDYIGGLWPWSTNYSNAFTGEIIRVGNGGFSLRSKKIMSIPFTLGLKTVYDRGFSNDDGLLCSYYRKQMLDCGIKYGSIKQSAVFSFENLTQENYGVKNFGYHRYLNPSIDNGDILYGT
jgi:hypothetical protein